MQCFPLAEGISVIGWSFGGGGIFAALRSMPAGITNVHEGGATPWYDWHNPEAAKASWATVLEFLNQLAKFRTVASQAIVSCDDADDVGSPRPDALWVRGLAPTQRKW
jgi:hypothetical protein